MKDIKGLIRLDLEKFSIGVQIKLFEKQSGNLVSQTISNVEGVFIFYQVPQGNYIIVAYPPLLNNNAQIKSYEIVV